jgi:hypothetical protein
MIKLGTIPTVLDLRHANVTDKNTTAAFLAVSAAIKSHTIYTLNLNWNHISAASWEKIRELFLESKSVAYVSVLGCPIALDALEVALENIEKYWHKLIFISSNCLNEWGEGIEEYESVVKPTHKKFAEMYKDSLTVPIVFEEEMVR